LWVLDLLAVHEDHRGCGNGRRLMERAEAVGRERGCHGVWLNTKALHAPGFYERLGYEVFGSLEADPPELTRILYRKQL
jgi:GNAT superfamily N-acetyltransferase